MFKVVLVLLVSAVGLESWSGPAKGKAPKGRKAVALKQSAKPVAVSKKISAGLTSDLSIKAELKKEASEALKQMVSKLSKSGPQLLSQKEAIFAESKQILGALKDKKGEKDNLELLVSLVSKQSLSMMSVKSKKQVENFHFLLTAINGRLISSKVSLSEVLKEATEAYVVKIKKVSTDKKEVAARDFLEALRKRCAR